MTKIIGLGLPKTGLKTLGKSLEILGYSVIVAPPAFARMSDEQAMVFANRRDAIIGMKGLIDTDLLLNLYPDSKIINTSRGKISWLQAMERRFGPERINKFDKQRLKEVFGVEDFSRGLFTQFWNDHSNYVRGVSVDNRDNFLDINLIANDQDKNWKILCEFLGKEIPDVPFPQEPSSTKSGKPVVETESSDDE